MGEFICPKCFHKFDYEDDEPSGEETETYCPECDFQINGTIEYLGYDTKQDIIDLIKQFCEIHNLNFSEFKEFGYCLENYFEKFIDNDFECSRETDSDWEKAYLFLWNYRHKFPNYENWKKESINKYNKEIGKERNSPLGDDYYSDFYKRWLKLVENEIPLTKINRTKSMEEEE